jgi:phasin family protein
MSLIQQEFLSFSTQSAFQSFSKFSQIVLDSAEQATQLSIKASRAILNGSLASGQSILGAHNVQELNTLSSSLAKPLISQTLDYSRALFEITSKAQESLGKLAENQYSEIRQSLDGFLERASDQSPAGTETSFVVAKSILSSANQAVDNALDQLNKVSKQANSIAEANIDTISELAGTKTETDDAAPKSATKAAASKAAK